MVLVDGAGLPLGVHLSPAHRAEVQLAEATLAQVAVPRAGPGHPKQKPTRIVADRGYDSRGLWQRIGDRGIDLIVPHLRHRHQRFQDGRKLRRYRRRWIIERTIAWLLSFTVRYERRLELYHAFLCLACVMIVLRRF